MSNKDQLKQFINVRYYALCKEKGRKLTVDEFHDAAKEVRKNVQTMISISDEEFAELVKRLECELDLTIVSGPILSDRRKNYSPWYENRRSTITPIFWERFRQYLLTEKGWTPNVVDPIDEVSSTIVGQLGDPQSNQPFKRKGLVIGDVQSGKTVNFTAICNKAVDAGYRIVIILAGVTDDLRKQTQRRFDKEFAGIDSEVLEHDEIPDKQQYGVGCFGYAEQVSFTTVNQEFNANAKRVNNISLNAVKEQIPIFCVVKKNVRILRNLLSWLRNHPGNLGPDQHIDLPLLIIDDESDNASVNVNDDDKDPTNTNRYIREIIALFNKVSYLAVTATPFANIFINPDTADEMLEDDLFPRDFIYVLSPPTSDQPLRDYFAYMGASQIFGNNSFSGIVQSLEDLETALPAKHKKDAQFACLPQSLKDAVAYFCLANVVRDLRGDTTAHRSMLIHISHRIVIHEKIQKSVLSYFNSLMYAAQNYGSDPEAAAKSEEIVFLKNIWDTYFSEEAECFWSKILPQIYKSIAPVVIRIVNSAGGNLDYDKHEEHGLRLIAIGGNCLSRGLTLEGLMVSYFRRTTKMYDTLLQMGRWFGYRPNYADLCKLWLTDEAFGWFKDITESYIELKNDIRIMADEGKSPKDFGMKVRTHPGALLPTARNKMRNARELKLPVSVAGRLLETPRILKDSIDHNEKTMCSFVSKLSRIGQYTPVPGANHFWKEVPADEVASFVSSFRTDPWNLMFQGADIAEYIERKPDQKWDVAIMEGAGDMYEFALESGEKFLIQTEQRKIDIEKRELSDNRVEEVVKISGKSVRVGAGGAAKVGLTPDQLDEVEELYKVAKANNPELGKDIPDNWYFAVDRPPILMLHVVQRKDDGSFIGAIGVGFPGKKNGEKETFATYRVNLIEWSKRQSVISDQDPDEQDEE